MIAFLRNAAIGLPVLIASAPTLAGEYYTARLSAAPAGTKLVIRDTVWTCGVEGCASDRSNSRPIIVCETLARKVGVLKSFTADGAALPPDPTPEMQRARQVTRGSDFRTISAC